MIHWGDSTFDDWGSAAHAFARDQLADRPNGTEKHADPGFPAVLDTMRETGFTGLCADVRLDGLGQSVAALARVLEPVAFFDATAAAAIYATAAAHLAIALSEVGDEKVGVLPAGDAGWLAWPAFSDLDEQRWPELDEAERLSGTVSLVLLAAHATGVVTPARGVDGWLRLVYVDLADEGVRRGETIRTVGLSAAGCADLTFSGATAVTLTTRGREVFGILAGQLSIGALALLHGVMRASVDAALGYAQERHQGGGPIIGWGEVRRLLSLQQERLRIASAVLGDVLTALAAGEDLVAARSGALHVGGLATDVTTDGVQLFGGNGYMQDYGQERRMRDARQLHGLAGAVAWRRQRLAPTGAVVAASVPIPSARPGEDATPLAPVG